MGVAGGAWSLHDGLHRSSAVYVVHCAGTSDRWPYLILLQAVPALLSLIVLPFLPDTPRYLLLVRGDRDGAMKGRDITFTYLLTYLLRVALWRNG